MQNNGEHCFRLFYDLRECNLAKKTQTDILRKQGKN